MFIGPAGWNMDHDDGSSEYHDYMNIVYEVSPEFIVLTAMTNSYF